MKKILAVGLLGAVGWFLWRDEPARWQGIPAAAEPVQTAAPLPAAFPRGSYTVTPLARYAVRAVVLSRERYRQDRGAELSPVDLALGWGPMSTATVINDLSFSQSARWYRYHWSHEPPLDPREIISHSANTHCLPADETVRAALLAIKRHELVTLEGYLVEVSAPDGYHWRSSLTRNDTAGGSCEVFWITRVEHRAL